MRDLPNVPLKECIDCQLVSHGSDLSASIDYEAGSMHRWTSGYGGFLETPKEDIERRVSSILELTKRHKIERLLDFGCGKGEMLRALSKKFYVRGVEPEAEARTVCIREQIIVYSSTKEAFQSCEKFDLVTMFHVIEHMYKPIEELKKLRMLLETDGLLLIETPNANDALLSFYRNKNFQEFTYWSHHPMLHAMKSLTSLLEYCKFEVISSLYVQRYSLDNHLYWLSEGKPGGHINWRDRFSKQTKVSYAQDLAENGISDTLYVIARKV